MVVICVRLISITLQKLYQILKKKWNIMKSNMMQVYLNIYKKKIKLYLT